MAGCSVNYELEECSRGVLGSTVSYLHEAAEENHDNRQSG
jgi:hypothetical protein